MGHSLDIEQTRGALIRLQRRLFRENAERISRAEAVPHPLFQQYQRAYSQATQRYREVSTIEALTRHARRAELVYVADYHTLPQAQKTFTKLARRMAIHPPERLVLALEIVQGKDQHFVDAYLGGEIDADTLRERIGFAQMWPYDVWENYLPIFEFARDAGHGVLGVDSNRVECDTLHGRDSYAGWRIAEHLHKSPNTKIMVLMGELHLAPEHLPGVVRANLAKLGQARSHISVHQNCEEIYWQLTADGLADVEVVRLDDDGWCVVNTPPIVRQQSYLNWIDFDESGLEYEHLTAHFARLADAICRFLEMAKCDALDDVTVYGPGETDFLSLFVSQGRYPREITRRLEHYITTGESFQLPRERIVYLARLTTNHAAEEGARFIRGVLTGRTMSPPTEPYQGLLDRAVGFVGSKILNHKRKTAHLADFMPLLRHAQAGRETVDSHRTVVARLVVSHRTQGLANGSDPPRVWSTPEGQDALRYIGNILGEQLYYGLIQGHVTRAEVRGLLGAATDSEEAAEALYFRWATRLADIGIPDRI